MAYARDTCKAARRARAPLLVMMIVGRHVIFVIHHLGVLLVAHGTVEGSVLPLDGIGNALPAIVGGLARLARRVVFGGNQFTRHCAPSLRRSGRLLLILAQLA